MREFIQTWWRKTPPRSRKGWQYLGTGIVVLLSLRVLVFLPSGVLLLLGAFGVGLTGVGVALIIWGSTDIDDLRSFRS